MAALATGVIQYMIDGIGFGWSFTLFGSLAAASALLYWVEMKRGMRWRVGVLGVDAEQVARPQRHGSPLVIGTEK